MHVRMGIIGLDRISTSFGLAIKRYQSQSKAQHTFTIIGSDTQAEPMKTAHRLGAIDNFDRKLHKAAENADVMILNAPAAQLEDLYARLGPELKPGAVVLDMAVLKGPSLEWAQRHLPTNTQGTPVAYMVGITPIVSARGLYSSDMSAGAATADLFDGADFLVTPDPTCPGEAITLAEDLIRLVGGQPRFMDPIEHDGLVAATEELPALLGAALFYMLQQSEGWRELRRMVNPTLALATQSLRFQSPQDMLMLFTRNRENLVRHLEGLIGVLDEMRDMLAAGDADRLEAALTLIQREWEKWDIKRHSGKWEDAPQVETLPGPFGSVGGLLTVRRKKKDNGEQ